MFWGIFFNQSLGTSAMQPNMPLFWNIPDFEKSKFVTLDVFRLPFNVFRKKLNNLSFFLNKTNPVVTCLMQLVMRYLRNLFRVALTVIYILLDILCAFYATLQCFCKYNNREICWYPTFSIILSFSDKKISLCCFCILKIKK